MDKINFTGFKNAGLLSIIVEDEKKMPILVNRAVLQLNDFGTKDLSQIERALGEEKKLLKNGFLQMDIYVPHQREGEDEITELNATKIFVNGKEIEKIPENIPILKRLSKLSTKVENENKDNFVKSNNYINSDEFEHHYKKDYDVKIRFDDDLDFGFVTVPERIKEGMGYFAETCDAMGHFIKTLWN